VTLGGSQVALCPATDQRGYTSAAATACDAGAVQTSGRPLTLKDSAIPGSFNHTGQKIAYHYQVTNTDAGTMTGIIVTDPAVPAVSCPAASLAPGASETCTGHYTITSADLAAGTVSDTATASGSADGVLGDSNTAKVTVREGWPPVVSGIHQPAAHAAEGYYLGVTGNTWSLTVTHPGTGKVAFTGTITLNAGAFSRLTRLNLGSGGSVTVSQHKTLTFSFTDSGTVKGIQFVTGPANTSISFALGIGANPATANQLYLGRKHTHPSSGSPLTFTR
jgi:hypothetical protein